MAGHPITLQSARKVSRLLNNKKHQPPKLRPEDLPSAGGGSVVIAYPPSTGVPAATYSTSTKELVTGKASALKAVYDGTKYTPGTQSIVIENIVGFAIATNGEPVVVELSEYGTWIIDVERCTVSSDPGGGPDPQPPVGSSLTIIESERIFE